MILKIIKNETFAKMHIIKNLFFCLIKFSLLGSIFSALPNECSRNLYVKIGAGGSFSQKAGIKVDNRFWDFAPEGYNEDIGNSEFYTVCFGYKILRFFKTDLEVSVRPSFKYKKFQSSSLGTQLGFIGTKTRFFRLSNTSIMGNFYLYASGLSDNLIFDVENYFSIEPFIGVGIGVAYNTINDFHSVLARTTNSNGLRLHVVGTVLPEFTKKTFAAQATFGLEFLAFDERLGIDLGYRFFYGGKIETNNFATSLNTHLLTKAATVPPWTGKLKSNEFFINLKLFFDF